MNKTKINTKRRNFLRASLRGGVCVLLGWLGIRSVARDGHDQGIETCLDPLGKSGCGHCRVFGSCKLPRGLSVKKHQQEVSHGK